MAVRRLPSRSIRCRPRHTSATRQKPCRKPCQKYPAFHFFSSFPLSVIERPVIPGIDVYPRIPDQGLRVERIEKSSKSVTSVPTPDPCIKWRILSRMFFAEARNRTCCLFHSPFVATGSLSSKVFGGDTPFPINTETAPVPLSAGRPVCSHSISYSSPMTSPDTGILYRVHYRRHHAKCVHAKCF